MKQFFIAALLFSVLLSVIFPESVRAEDRSIIVNGIAEKSLDPNMVSMSVEVWSKAGTAKQAQSMAAQEFKQVKKTFEDFKVKKEDIQTENYALDPDYQYDEKARQNKLVGYRVTQTLRVTLRKVEDTGNFLDALIVEKKSNNAGVNVSSIGWDSDKRAQLETTALGDAVRAAKNKAEEIAKAAGVKIKGVSKISHTIPAHGGPQPVFRNLSMKGGAEMDAASTEVSAGQVKVRVEVTAEYNIN